MTKAIAKKLPHGVPADLRRMLDSSAGMRAVWDDITPLARNEWICWIISPKKVETRKNISSERESNSSLVSGARVVGRGAHIGNCID